jgi:photosystem II stability/assembly factor-like uncharacterized protein
MKTHLIFIILLPLVLFLNSCSEQPSEPEKKSIWEKVSTLPSTIGLIRVEDNKIYAACYGAESDIFIVSSDFGKSWQTSSLGSYIQELGFLEIIANEGFLSGTDGLYRSEDYGYSWFKDTVLANYVGSDGRIPCLFAISFKDNEIYLGQLVSTMMDPSYINGIFKTTDNGNQWYCPNNAPRIIWALVCTESNIVVSNAGKIYYSPDDCETWIEAVGEFGQHYTINKLYKIDLRIYALGDGDKIYYSDNEGVYWNNCSDGLPPYNQAENQSLDWLTFTSSEHYLFILRTDGVIYYSSKESIDWKIFNSELPAKYYWKLFVVDNYLYYSSSNKLWRTKITD